MKRFIALLLIGSMMALTACTPSVPLKETAQLEAPMETTASEPSAAATENFDSQGDIPETLTPVQEDFVDEIRVSFAENYMLDVVYYKNAEKTEAIDKNACVMKPGDCIYAGEAESVKTQNGRYFLKEYRISQYGEDGKVSSTTRAMLTQDGFVFRIPDTYKGERLEIAAVGEYENQVIELKTYLREKYGDAQSEMTSESDEYWTLNGTKLEADSTVIATGEVNAVRYYYDTKKYYYVDSEPAALNAQPDRDGYVEFSRSDPRFPKADYNVVLRESLSLTLESSCNAAVMKNIRGIDYPIELAKASEDYRIEGLHPGDRITFMINDEKGYVRIIDGDYRYMQAESVTDYSRSRKTYELVVCDTYTDEKADELQKNIAVLRNIKVILPEFYYYGKDEEPAGTFTYIYNGQKVSGEVEVKEGDLLKIALRLNEGYEFVPHRHIEYACFDVHQINHTVVISESYDGKILDAQIEMYLEDVKRVHKE